MNIVTEPVETDTSVQEGTATTSTTTTAESNNGTVLAPTQDQARPDWSSWVNENGEFNEGWYKSFPEETHKVLGKYQTAENFVNGFLNAQKLIGKKGVSPIHENSTEVEIQEFRNQMGIPESPDGYEFNSIDGLEIDETSLNDFKKLSHELNIPASTAQKIVEYDIQRHQNALQQHEQSIEESSKQTIKTIQDEFKNDWQSVIKNAHNVAKTFGSDELRNDPAFANNPEVIKFLNNIAIQMGNDPLIQSDTSANISISLNDKINEITQHPGYMDTSHPMNKQLKQQIKPLFEKRAMLKAQGKM